MESKRTNNIRMEITVEGVTLANSWACGFEFDMQKDESFIPGPKDDFQRGRTRMRVPDEIGQFHVAFLPPVRFGGAELE